MNIKRSRNSHPLFPSFPSSSFPSLPSFLVAAGTVVIWFVTIAGCTSSGTATPGAGGAGGGTASVGTGGSGANGTGGRTGVGGVTGTGGDATGGAAAGGAAGGGRGGGAGDGAAVATGGGGPVVDAGGDTSVNGGGEASDGGAVPNPPDGGAMADAGAAPTDGGAPPPLTGPTVAGTVTVARGASMGRLSTGFAGFSFEKTHLTDGFFTGSHAALIAMFKLLGPGIVRIGADDVNISVWTPNATFVPVGTTSPNMGTAEVDALADFLTATGWKAIYAVNMRGQSTPQTAVTELDYVVPKLGSHLAAVEIGNELNLYGLANVQQIWHSYAVAIHAAFPAVVVAGPGAYLDINFALPFIQGEASQIGMVTHHYYRGTAGTSAATLTNLLTPDPAVVSESQAMAASVQSNGIRGGYRWGEMNSFSSHGQIGVSDGLGSALWGVNFMLTTALYGSAGVNFHGGGQNMDGNVCPNGAASCNRPFRYSPLLEIDSRVTAAAPLFYGMLLVSRAGTGGMLGTTVAAGNINLRAYTVAQADGSMRIVLVNSDSATGVNASVNVGAAVASASAVYLRGPSLTATTGVTLAGAPVTPQGAWAPQPGYALAHAGNVITVPVPAASAVLLTAR